MNNRSIATPSSLKGAAMNNKSLATPFFCLEIKFEKGKMIRISITIGAGILIMLALIATKHRLIEYLSKMISR
jgi:hypothetical protein